MFSLQERVWQKDMHPDDLSREADWNSIFQILDKEREKSYMYLEKIIKE